MTIEKFETEIQEIRSRNGWRIELDLIGIWSVYVYDKETDKLLATTGATSLYGVLVALRHGINSKIWGHGG